MVRSCSLRNCNNSVRQKYRFFLLPSVKKVAKRAAWLQQCDYLLTEPLPTSGNSISLCEGHFEPDQFVEYGPSVRTILKPTAIPTIFTKNPPRVSDAVELWYEREYKHNNTLSLLNDLTDDSIIYNNDNQDNEVELLEELNDDNGFEYVDVEDTPPKRVKLIRIQRNKMQIATPQGIKIISASCKTQLNNINMAEHTQVEHFEEGLSPPSSNDMENVDDNSSSFVTMSGKRYCLDVDNKQVAFKVSGDGSLGLESLESEHDQAEYDHHPENYNQDPGNYNYIESGNSNFNSNYNYNCYSNKRKVVNSTFKKQHKYEITPVFIKKEIVDDEIDDKSRLRDIMHFNISQTDSIESNEAHEESANEAFDPVLLKNLKTSDHFDNDNDNRNYIINDDDQLHDDQSQDLDNDIDYSQLIMSASDLQKRVNELEIEKDSIIKKYRRLELKMETFQNNLRTFLNEDQIKLLQSQSPSMNTTSWSAETLKKSAKVRCIVGPRAYEYLRSQEHYPLPSFRTLYRHREISRINDYTDEMIQEHMNATINRVAMVAEESEVSDADEEIDGEEDSEILDVARIKQKVAAQRPEPETEIEQEVLVENNSEPEHIDFDALDPEIEEDEEEQEQEEIDEIEYEPSTRNIVQDILMNIDNDILLPYEDIAAIDEVRYVPEKTST
ncbi:GSCOCG00004020001-RA-CDS [Cotesia congregata]|nr:GSCOCG00004020001-RA-CDS [Cotesia congregata]